MGEAPQAIILYDKQILTSNHEYVQLFQLRSVSAVLSNYSFCDRLGICLNNSFLILNKQTFYFITFVNV